MNSYASTRRLWVKMARSACRIRRDDEQVHTVSFRQQFDASFASDFVQFSPGPWRVDGRGRVLESLYSFAFALSYRECPFSDT